MKKNIYKLEGILMLLKINFLSCVLVFAFLLTSCPTINENNYFYDIPDVNEGKHIFLSIGQSNMSGGAQFTVADQQIIPNVYLFDIENNWVEASSPLHRFVTFSDEHQEAVGRNVASARNSARLSPAHDFLVTLSLSFPGWEFGIVANAVSATRIDLWQGPGDPLFDAAVIRTREAMKTGTLRGIIWHQGEGNSGDTDYAQKLTDLINNFRIALGEPGSPLDVPFIAGETIHSLESGNRRTVNEQIALVKTNNMVQKYDFITSIGTTPYDATHFDTDSTRLIGYRYAQKMLKLAYGIPVDEAPPSVPQGLRILSRTESTVTLAWYASTDNIGVTGYEVFRYPEPGSYNAQNKAVAFVSGLQVTIPITASNNEFAVRAFDKAGNISEKSPRIGL